MATEISFCSSQAEAFGTESYQFVWLCILVTVQNTEGDFDLSLNSLSSGELSMNSMFFLLLQMGSSSCQLHRGCFRQTTEFGFNVISFTDCYFLCYRKCSSIDTDYSQIYDSFKQILFFFYMIALWQKKPVFFFWLQGQLLVNVISPANADKNHNIEISQFNYL